jgi:hypothetical protein
MITKNKIIKEKTLGCKVSEQMYDEFQAEAEFMGLSISELIRRKLFEGGSVHNLEIPRKKAFYKAKSKRKRITVIADDSRQVQTAPKTFDFPDFGLLIKPYPEDCNPIYYYTAGEKLGALVRRMQCLNLRAMVIQASVSPKS